MTAMSEPEFERQAVLYAMGALAPEEARRFEAERARRGAGGERLERGVREAIERAGAGPRDVALSERETLDAVTAQPGERPPWGWTAAVAALAIVCSAAVVWGLGERSRAREGTELARLEAREADSLRAALDETTAALDAQPRVDELLPLLAAAGLAVVPLAGAGETRGRMFSAEGGGALLLASGLATLGGGTYQLWRRTGDLTEPVAALGDAPRGFLFALFTDGGFLDGADAILVTAEPGPGAVLPTEPAVLEGRPRP